MNEIKRMPKNLTPIKLDKSMPGYNTVLDIEEILKDSEVYNIAITGPYGSGKSSVLKTLKEKCTNYKYLTISLALLTGKKKGIFSRKEQQEVEFSILQQLIYREKPQTLPNSRFCRIEQRTKCQAFRFGVAVLAFIVAFLIVFEPQWAMVDTLCNVFNLGYGWNLTFDIVSSLWMLYCILKIVMYLYRRPSLWRIKAFNMKDVSIELGKDSSVFNKHLDEIVYFFESTEYNVVIIEDLDRFLCPDIFLKFREINFLLQQSKVLKEQERRVKFIYAVKDDLFMNEERTKFFDYITTVIPVVNPKNSCEKLTQELAERGYYLDKDVLMELSEFVDGMRMLINVANEFHQHMKQMSKSFCLKKENLLAMIIYKNRHPDDFCKLHYKEGKVYKIISKKDEWVKIAIDEVLKPKLEMLQKRREEELNSQNSTLKDWRIRYMKKYEERMPNLVSICCNNKDYHVSDFIETPKLFEDLIQQPTISYQNTFKRGYKFSIDINLADLEKELDDGSGYMMRKISYENNIYKYDKEIEEVQKESELLKSFKLAELLIKFPKIKKSKLYQDIELSELMVHFLQRGYIDETYYDYITLYDGTIMSLNDRNLLLRIKQNDVNISYDEKIDDVKALVNELPLYVYKYKSVLNYQIADYLEENSTNYELELKDFEQNFVESSTPQLDFLANYYKRKSKGAEKLWKKYVDGTFSWQHIQTYEKQEYRDTLAEAWLRYREYVWGESERWLNNNLGFCIERLDKIGLEHLKKIIKECVFVDISALGPVEGKFQGDNVMDVANYILEKGLFMLTGNNLFVACEITCGPFNYIAGAEFLTISDILSSNNDGFIDYVKRNFKFVFDNIISKSKGQETEEGLLYILNHEELDEVQKTEYLKSQTDCEGLDLTQIIDSSKQIALRSDVLRPNWENVLNYYIFEQETISADLENFINNNVDSLAKDEFPTDSESSLAGKIVYEHYLSFTAYEKLLPVLIQHTGRDGESKLSKDTELERLELLVNNNYLSDKAETANVVFQHGTYLYARYLSYHIDSYIANVENYGINSATLTVLLNSESSLSDEQRWNLAKKISPDLIEQDVELTNLFLELMLNRKDELAWDVVVAVIRNATKQPQKQQFQKMLIECHRESVEEVTIILKSMGEPYSNIMDDSKKTLIPIEFKDYLEIIKPLGLFTSFREVEGKGYRVYHHR